MSDPLHVRVAHRTGCGKTLAFVLPAAELLAQDKAKARAPGRPPRAIVLVPTRELAKQVEADFAHVGASLGLSTACLYGGASYGSQEGQLRRGVDVIVGTPGRVKDHLERGTLRLDSLRWVPLPGACAALFGLGIGGWVYFVGRESGGLSGERGIQREPSG